MLIGIDEIIVVSCCQHAILALLRNLKEEFALKDHGELHYFLGIGGILLTQDKYTLDFLKRVGMKDCKPVNTVGL